MRATQQLANTRSCAIGNDQFGRMTSAIDAVGTTVTTYAYNADGQCTNRWTAFAGNTEYKYDQNGNIWYRDNDGCCVTQWSRDALNRLTTVQEPTGWTTTFTYTSFGALASESGTLLPDYTITYGYQTNHLRSSMSLAQPNASPWVETYTYDGANRLHTITAPEGGFTYTYASAGNLIRKITYPNGAYVTNAFDALGRLTTTALNNSASTALNSHSYVYNNANQRTRHTRFDGSYVDFGYDNIGQLASASGKEPGGSATRLHEQFWYGYDAAGNLYQRTNNALVQTFNNNSLNELTTISRPGGSTLTVAGTTTSAATSITVNGYTATRYGDSTFAKDGMSLVDGMNSFTAVAQDSYGRAATNSITLNLPASVSYSYDTDGNLTGAGSWVYTYDYEDRLITATLPNVRLTSYTYDDLNRVRRRQELGYGTVNGTTGYVLTNADVRYVYSGSLVIQERDVNNIPLVTYTRGWDLSGTCRDAAGGIGGLLARTDNLGANIPGAAPASAYYHADGNGNVTTLINAQQVPVARYLYDSFGNLISKSGSLADGNVYRFSSKEYDASTGLYYFGRRFYDPNLQRWLNRDPLANPVSGQDFPWSRATGTSVTNAYTSSFKHNDQILARSLYTFAQNEPITRIDSWGLLDGATVPYSPATLLQAPAIPKTPLQFAESMDGSWIWWEYSFLFPTWFGAPKCNKFVWACFDLPGIPDPTKATTEDGRRIYPRVLDVQDPTVTIPGFGPPHRGPFHPGDIVTDGGAHMGIVGSNGVWQASSRTGTVFQAPPGNGPGTFNPVWGRTPLTLNQ